MPYSYNSERIGRDGAILETTDPEAKTYFYEKIEREWNKNPNNIIYDIKKSTKTEQKTIPAEYHILKRRQLTAQGSKTPINPCDDKGKPLFLTDKNEVTTKTTEKIAWGDWIDGSLYDNRVTIRASTINRSKCDYASYGNSLSKASSIENANRIIAEDQRYHHNQQEKKVGKVAVDYQIKKIKDEEPYTLHTYTASLQKVKDYPASWQDVKFTLDDPIALGGSIKIELAGNFSGRKYIQQEIKDHTIFAMYPLIKGMRDAGFKSLDTYSSRGKSFVFHPDKPYACEIQVDRKDIAFRTLGFYMRRIESEDKKLPLGGFFMKASFHIHKIDNDDREAMHYFKFSNPIPYETKAPKEAVEFCHQKFREASADALISFLPDNYKK